MHALQLGALYVHLLATSIDVTATRLTYASCCLARVAMPKPYSEYTKQLVVYHHRQGLKPGDISRILQEKGIMASRRGIAKFLAKFIESGSVARKPGSERPSKVTAKVRKIIEEAMHTDDETTAKAYLESYVSLSMPFLESC